MSLHLILNGRSPLPPHSATFLLRRKLHIIRAMQSKTTLRLNPAPELLPRIPGLRARTAVRNHIIACERCPRLRAYCQKIGEVRRRAYMDEIYWSRPVPGFGDPAARVLILGLAPGAHGANRTGRPFTGDGAGYFMYPVLHQLGFANQPRGVSPTDGLVLEDAWIASVVRCAPPGDKPLPQEIRNCSSHLAAEIDLLRRVQIVVCLGKIAFDGYLTHLHGREVIPRKSAYRFAHHAEYLLPNGLHLLASYHPSLRNTNTGRLDEAMFASVFLRARELAGLPPPPSFTNQ